jgi:hypothetical protein
MVVIAIELVNIEIILTSVNPVDIVYKFVSLAVIAEFDDFVYSALKNEPMKILITEEITDSLLVIRHTTSPACGSHELSTVFD